MNFKSFGRSWPASQGSISGSIGGVCALTLTAAATGATLLGFPSPSDISAGRFLGWRASSPYAPPPASPWAVSLTYAIQADLLANQSAFAPGEAAGIVRDTLNLWTDAARGRVTFTEAPWSAVRNEGPAPPDQWEGPGILDWLSGAFPGTTPGWGANVEVFSVPTGFTITSQSLTFSMNPNVLGFTVVNRIGSRTIVSVDIYLNESFTWFDAEAPASASGGANENNQIISYDLRAVVLHEVGHAMGLDHPNQAVLNGSWNISPILFNPGDPWSSSDLMHSVYTGPRSSATLDEVGGLAIVHGWKSPVDANGDGHIDGHDITQVLSDWGGNISHPRGDINFDQVVNASDISMILTNWGAQPESPGDPANWAPTTEAAGPSTPIFRECYAAEHAPAAHRPE
ncbi:MAG: hypothetical protein D6693_09405 [Planctomycetota bacterium]|nr:MAG: hypothetical protein D6693_09405 [Planctomycetota bacterium]